MVTEQARQMAEFYASIAKRVSKAYPDVATMRDIDEGLHVCGTEPEGVTYAEVDAGGVPALWCIPQGSDTEHVLLHSHKGGAGGLLLRSHRKPPRDAAPGTGGPRLGGNFPRVPGRTVSPPNRAMGKA